jgi:hypothetical protein
MPSQLLYHTIYKVNNWGHGGEKRTAQLNELYKNAGIQQVDYQPENLSNNIRVFSIFNSLIAICSIYTPWQFGSTRAFFRFWKSIILQYGSLLRYFNNEEKVFVWESTKDIYYFLPFFAKKYKKKVIALPHNLESLVPGQVSVLTGKSAPSEFSKEIKVLKKCDAVFTISHEEALLLKLFKINSYYLPYYPPTETEQFLLNIRKQRQMRQPNKITQILLLGSAINPPTRIGMESRINFFKQNSHENIKLSIAGYGTEQLLTLIGDTKQFKFLGELTVGQLEKEFISTDAVLIHQPASSGALSRIIELLIAGIPVLANEDSARNYTGYDGITIYYNDKQLYDLLRMDFDKMPAIPVKPQIQYDQFVKKIEEYNS